MVEVIVHQNKRHKHSIYSLVIILAILQITSVLILSAQIAKTNIALESKIKRTENLLIKYTNNLIESYDSVYRTNFQTISNILSTQKTSLEQEIKLLKSSQNDFSEVAREAVKSVVAISAGDSMGTGFFIAPGYIITNYHVVAKQESDIYILTYDRKKIKAEYVGGNSKKDIALLKIGENYKSLEFASLDEIEVGQKVIAIGNPLGLTFTVTEGIISGLNRPGPDGSTDYLQTDVPLNPGNSGGPLINMNSKVVGITNFKIGGAESLGFALQASSTVREEINKIAGKTIV